MPNLLDCRFEEMKQRNFYIKIGSQVASTPIKDSGCFFMTVNDP